MIPLSEVDKVQLLYVKLTNGKTLVFMGAPILDEDFDQIEKVVLGECVSPRIIEMAAVVESSTTAH